MLAICGQLYSNESTLYRSAKIYVLSGIHSKSFLFWTAVDILLFLPTVIDVSLVK